MLHWTWIFVAVLWAVNLLFVLPAEVYSDTHDEDDARETTIATTPNLAKKNNSLPIPNPFSDDYKGYYLIRSHQNTLSIHKLNKLVAVEEYFSLKTGLSYSIHTDEDDRVQKFAILGDGPNGKSYIVSNPDGWIHDVNCELDHLHHHRQIFPWQYVYDGEKTVTQQIKEDEEKMKRRGSKNRWFVYGVGAIWLNAIKSKVVSDEVGENSPYVGFNLWKMQHGDVEVKLVFKQPGTSTRKLPVAQLTIWDTDLHSIKVRRGHVIETEHRDMGGTNKVEYETDLIALKWSDYIDANGSEGMPARILDQLKKCREQTKKHRVFPSLMRAVSLSPNRLFAIKYVEKKFRGGVRESEQQQNSSGQRKFANGYHTEWFSFDQETQVTISKGLPEELHENLPNSGEVDIYMKRFTGTATSERSSHHSTVYYHMIERGGSLVSCTINEAQPLPENHLMSRPVHFHRDSETHGTIRMTGHLTGVGALILNAADFHYKHFNLLKKNVSVTYEPTNLLAREIIQADEWQFLDKKTNSSVHFYFRALDGRGGGGGTHEITDLVRIDVRNAQIVDSIVESSSFDDGNNPDMLLRFDIISISTETSQEEIEFVFAKPDFCEDSPRDEVQPDDDDSEYDSSLDGDYPSTDDESSDGSGESQNEALEFEFEPGKLMESFQFPDFFEFIDGRPAYEIRSTIEIMMDDSKDGDTITTKRIHLFESVDIRTETAKFSIFNSDKSRKDAKPDLEYYANYMSEIVFKVVDGHCSLVEDMEPWMRLLSAPIKYYRIPGTVVDKKSNQNSDQSADNVIIESNKLRLYGVGALWRQASESEYTDFVGMKREVILRPNGDKFREVLWTLNDEGDADMELEFKFLWDLTQSELDAGHHHHRRAIDLLRLDSIYISKLVSDKATNNSGDTTKFKRFKIFAPSFYHSNSHSWALPDTCQGALAEATSLTLRESKIYANITIPSLLDFIGTTNSYSINYTVSHWSPMREGQTLDSTFGVSEQYDRSANRGRLSIGSEQNKRDIFIDGAKKSIYSFMESRKICKPITTLKTLVDIGPSLNVENNDFNPEKLYGLAALWLKLSELKRVFLTVTYKHDRYGNKIEVRKYKAFGEWSSKTMSGISDKIEITFVGKSRMRENNLFRGYMKTRMEDEFELESIKFSPEMVWSSSDSHETPLHHTTIVVQSFEPNVSPPSDWTLPDECQNLANNRSYVNFPSIMNLIKPANQFYMKSEIVSSPKPLISENKTLFMLEEWLYNGDIRVKTYGLENDIDVLIYSNTEESFDLSTPYRCFSALPQLDKANHPRTGSNLVQFWSDREALIDYLSSLYYGPVALWRLAEKNIANVKLANSADIAPKLTGDAKVDSIEREMRTETWRVDSPDNSHQQSWSYDLHFEINSEIGSNKKVREWRLLTRVELTNYEYLGIKRKVEIEVINYKYDQSANELLDKFLLPEGYGCTRSQKVLDQMERDSDDLALDRQLDHALWYEASLEMAESVVDPKLGLHTKTVVPTIVGAYVRSASSPSEELNMGISAHYHHLRYSNGTNEFTKTVYDSTDSLRFLIDLMTGLCRIDQVSQASWLLEFPANKQVEIVNLFDVQFDLLFLNTIQENYIPINKYARDGFSINTYEHSYDNLMLTTSLVGPATVVRKYQYFGEDPPPSRIDYDTDSLTRMHDSVGVKILMFDQERTKIQAILNIFMQQKPNFKAVDVIAETNVAQCYNYGNPMYDRGVGSFVLEYLVQLDYPNWLISVDQTRIEDISRDFMKILINNAGILPIQLDGAPRVEFSSTNKGLMKIHFNLLDAPTAIEYFYSQWECRMTDLIEFRSEVKLIPSIYDCSRWCDQVDCIALSYCTDHTCRLLTANMWRDSLNLSTDIPLTFQEISKLGSCARDPDCTYYHQIKPRPRTLQKFAESMNMIVNEAQNASELANFALTLSGQSGQLTVPVLFDTLKRNFIEAEDDDDNPDMPGKYEIKGYKILKRGHKLDLAQLLDLEATKINLTSSVGHAHSIPECLDLCKKDDCIVLSYCKRDSSCTMFTMSDEKGDNLRMKPLIGPQQVDCLIYVRDFLDEYARFLNTAIPSNFETKLDNYTALECAASCKLADDDCLSFDFCTLKIEEHTGGGSRLVEESSESDSTESEDYESEYTDLIDSYGSRDYESEDSIDETGSVCFLQKTHVMLDSFDRAILAPNWHLSRSSKAVNKYKGQEFVCEHFSKAVLADYHKLPGKELATKRNSVMRGSNAEKCAIECQQDAECLAFEYCFNDKLQPVQACYFIRSEEIFKTSDSTDHWSKQLDKQLKVSKLCSVYTIRHSDERYKLDSSNNYHVFVIDTNQAMEKHGNLLHYVLTALSYIVISIIVASVIQFVYIRFIGEPLIFNN